MAKGGVMFSNVSQPRSIGRASSAVEVAFQDAAPDGSNAVEFTSVAPPNPTTRLPLETASSLFETTTSLGRSNRHQCDDSGGLRYLLLHADDYGMNLAINAGILRGFRHGLLTSTSLLANAPAAGQALDEWRNLQGESREGRIASARFRRMLGDDGTPFDLGVHLNLTQGRPMLQDRYPRALLNRQGRFPGIASLLLTRQWFLQRPHTRAALLAELRAQIEFVLARGFQPTHLNGHEYVELIPQVGEMVIRLAKEYAIPVVRAAVEKSPPIREITPLMASRPPHQAGPAWIAFRNGLAAPLKNWLARRFQRRLREFAQSHPPAFAGCHHAGRVTFDVVRQFVERQTASLLEIGLHPGMSTAQFPGEDEKVPLHDGWRDPLQHLRPFELEWLTSGALAPLLAVKRIRLGRMKHCLQS